MFILLTGIFLTDWKFGSENNLEIQIQITFFKVFFSCCWFLQSTGAAKTTAWSGLPTNPAAAFTGFTERRVFACRIRTIQITGVKIFSRQKNIAPPFARKFGPNYGRSIESQNVDIHSFRGLEKNPVQIIEKHDLKFENNIESVLKI